MLNLERKERKRGGMFGKLLCFLLGFVWFCFWFWRWGCILGERGRGRVIRFRFCEREREELFFVVEGKNGFFLGGCVKKIKWKTVFFFFDFLF